MVGGNNVIMRATGVTEMEILQVGHLNFTWILFQLIMSIEHIFLYFSQEYLLGCSLCPFSPLTLSLHS